MDEHWAKLENKLLTKKDKKKNDQYKRCRIQKRQRSILGKRKKEKLRWIHSVSKTEWQAKSRQQTVENISIAKSRQQTGENISIAKIIVDHRGGFLKKLREEKPI